jgi:glucose/arabinose dehydrogenase
MKFRNKKFLSVILALIAIVIVVLAFAWWNFKAQREADLPTAPAASLPVVTGDTSGDGPLAVSVAENLEIPWALDFLPDGSIVFTERAGRVRLVDAREGLLPQPLLTIAEVAHRGEGGLLGIARHPDFNQNRFVYLYHTYSDGEDLLNRVLRFKIQGRTLIDRTVIIDSIPGATIHNGGRIRFGPDGLLYITTGDASIPDFSQDRDSLAGKILRLNDDGTVPPDNPFPGSPVYSFGHRNPQGLAWDSQGRLWATEHGSRATDELNLIEPGRNYGWPLIRGDEKADGLESPVVHSGGDTWAPSGVAFSNGSLFFAALRGQSLFEARIENQTVMLNRHLNKSFGRLRDVVVGPDNLLYLLTSNRDGRGVPTEEDDQVIRINPGKL